MDAIHCDICPKQCRISPGQNGDCGIRANVNGEIRLLTYGYPCSAQVDPVEKKPLFHFLPGSQILSIATVGCNLHCRHCQNWEISQAGFDGTTGPGLSPEELAAAVLKYACPSVAYTYTEPLVAFEYTRDCCEAVRSAGLRNVLVTAAYVNPKPWREICTLADAANIDIKAMSDEFYRDICSARLKPVLENCVAARETGVHIEITNLVIPTLNDSEKDLRDLCEWVRDNLGANTPMHFSRFFPRHKLNDLPPTPPSTLLRAYETARECGLLHVYVGNIGGDREWEDTRCGHCHTSLIERNGYRIRRNRLENGRCPDCRTPLAGVWR